jgi:hypothetical protein
MENIKEELRQLIKDKILSTIMESKKFNKFKKSKKANKPNKSPHLARGPSRQRTKLFGKGGDAITINTQRRREGKEQAAQIDEEIHAPAMALAGLITTGFVGLGLDALRQKFLFPRNIKKLKANLTATQKVPTVGTEVTPEEADYQQQYNLHHAKLESRELQRARANGRTPQPIDPQKVHDSIIRSQNSGLNASINRNIPSTWI